MVTQVYIILLAVDHIYIFPWFKLKDHAYLKAGCSDICKNNVSSNQLFRSKDGFPPAYKVILM
jgi:hypothetical protein